VIQYVLGRFAQLEPCRCPGTNDVRVVRSGCPTYDHAVGAVVRIAAVNEVGGLRRSREISLDNANAVYAAIPVAKPQIPVVLDAEAHWSLGVMLAVHVLDGPSAPTEGSHTQD